MRSQEMLIYAPLCSGASIQDTKYWWRRNMFNTSCRIVW